jgi:hypothetical protein
MSAKNPVTNETHIREFNVKNGVLKFLLLSFLLFLSVSLGMLAHTWRNFTPAIPFVISILPVAASILFPENNYIVILAIKYFHLTAAAFAAVTVGVWLLVRQTWINAEIK